MSPFWNYWKALTVLHFLKENKQTFSSFMLIHQPTFPFFSLCHHCLSLLGSVETSYDIEMSVCFQRSGVIRCLLTMFVWSFIAVNFSPIVVPWSLSSFQILYTWICSVMRFLFVYCSLICKPCLDAKKFLRCDAFTCHFCLSLWLVIQLVTNIR